ncbi:MAG TPA: hypothetical protein VN428_00775 [Bryobacteraceae bacterium]|nr:hypothetical protein [Bryobacteraceae bacterium]
MKRETSIEELGLHLPGTKRVLPGDREEREEARRKALEDFRKWLHGIRVRPVMTELCDALVRLIDRGRIRPERGARDSWVFHADGSEAQTVLTGIRDPLTRMWMELIVAGHLLFRPAVMQHRRTIAFYPSEDFTGWLSTQQGTN